MHGGLNKVYLQNFLGMSVIFRDESNDNNKSIINYSDATVLSSNRAVTGLIRFFKVTSVGSEVVL